LKKQGEEMWSGFMWLRIGTGVVNTVNELSGSIKGVEFLQQLREFSRITTLYGFSRVNIYFCLTSNRSMKDTATTPPSGVVRVFVFISLSSLITTTQ
jgi:hypothetical protein